MKFSLCWAFLVRELMFFSHFSLWVIVVPMKWKDMRESGAGPSSPLSWVQMISRLFMLHHHTSHFPPVGSLVSIIEMILKRMVLSANLRSLTVWCFDMQLLVCRIQKEKECSFEGIQSLRHGSPASIIIVCLSGGLSSTSTLNWARSAVTRACLVGKDNVH